MNKEVTLNWKRGRTALYIMFGIIFSLSVFFNSLAQGWLVGVIYTSPFLVLFLYLKVGIDRAESKIKTVRPDFDAKDRLLLLKYIFGGPLQFFHVLFS